MKYILHWKTREVEQVEGESVSRAFTAAGYGAGAVRALDYYETVKESKEEQEKLENESTSRVR